MRYPKHLPLSPATRAAIASARSHRSRNSLLSARLLLSCGLRLGCATRAEQHRAQLQQLRTFITRS